MTEPTAPADEGAGQEQFDLAHWRRSTDLLDLEDSRLRLRARALTQLCKSDRERALAVYGFVKRMPFAKPFKMRLRTAREVLDAGQGDAPDKATALVALLRLAGLPARLHYYLLRGEILRGITSTLASAARPVAEIWLDGHWVCTDTYIFDATYVAAARQRLKDAGWDWGYGIHTKAHTLWNGKDDAYLGGVAPDKDEMVISDLGVFDEPQAYVNSATYQNNHTRLTRAVHWNMLAPTMDKVARELRDDFGPSAAGSKKPS